MWRNGRVLFSGVVTLAAAWALVETAGWPIKTALYPRVITIPLLLLAAAETVLNLRQKEEADAGEAIDVAFSTEVPEGVAARRTATMIAWFAGFFLAVIVIGFTRAIPLFVFTYLRRQGREGWILSLLLTAFAWLVFQMLFVRLLHLPFADGLLWDAVFD